MAASVTETEIRRTLAIVHQLAEGKRLDLPNGLSIAMGEDMSIGFVMASNGNIGSLSTMTLADLNQICNKYNIGFPIPK